GSTGRRALKGHSLPQPSPEAPLYLPVSRLVVGLGVGADYAVIFPYLAEVAAPNRRSKIMAWTMWAANFGMVFAYGLGALVLNQDQGWRIPLLVGSVLVVPLLWLRRALPESDLWMRRHVHSWHHLWEALTTPKTMKVVSTASINWFSYQASDQGLSLFLPSMLAALFASSVASASWRSLLVKVVTIPAALATVYAIDRVGRRPLQLWGFLGRGLALLALGAIILHMPSETGTSHVLVFALLVAAYALGAFGPDKTTVMAASEETDTAVRSTAQGISEGFGRLGGVVGVAGYSFLAFRFGTGAGMVFFGLLTLLGFVVTAVQPRL
ncbi:MFS transporter, partial [Sulfobacillus harzensis]